MLPGCPGSPRLLAEQVNTLQTSNTQSTEHQGPFPNLGVCGVPMIRITVFWGVYCRAHIHGNYRLRPSNAKLENPEA